MSEYFHFLIILNNNFGHRSNITSHNSFQTILSQEMSNVSSQSNRIEFKRLTIQSNLCFIIINVIYVTFATVKINAKIGKRNFVI
jgi:hypothetical protein